MIDLSFDPIEELHPYKMMLFYNKDSEYYVETTDIHNGKAGIRKPATIESLSFLRELSIPEVEKNNPIKLIGDMNRFLYFDNDVDDTHIVWVSSPKTREINYMKKKYIYHVPQTVWVYKGKDDVYVFTLKGKSKLCRLAAPNVFEDGKICWGNVDLPNFSTSDDLLEIEDSFFNSKFSDHLNIGNFPCDIDDFYKMDKNGQYNGHIDLKRKLKELLYER